MANDVRQIKEMEDIVTCSICKDLYTDARTLTCQHCFCLKCLNDYQTFALVKQCPICRADTVPAVGDLHLLPPNRALNDMVDLMVKFKGGSQSNGNQQRTAPPSTNAQTHQFPPTQYAPNIRFQPAASQPTVRRTHTSPGETSHTAGGSQSNGNQQRTAPPSTNAQRHNFLPPRYPPNERNQPTASQPTVRRTHTPPSETSQTTAASRPQSPLSSNNNEGLLGLLVANLRRETMQEKRTEVSVKALAEAFAGVVLSGMDGSEVTHEGIYCDECHTRNITGARYKCGVCADYDLCERCERKPRMLVHNTNHIFVKLRRPATCLVARGQIHHPVGYSIGQQMRFDSNIHTIVLSANQYGQNLMLTGTFYCDRCGENPIRGTRFKCGMCDDYDLCASCESDSPSFHHRNHVFLVIPQSSNACQDMRGLFRVNFY